MSGERAKGGKKNRKYGRNANFCQRYRLEGREDKNRAMKMARHLKRHPEDKQAEGLLKKLRAGR